MKAHLSSILPRALQRLAHRAAACATLLALALACNPAAAQNVLFLHTNEPTHPDADLDAYTNLKNEFTAAGATITDVGGLQTAGSISAATFTAPSGGAYDLVIMASAYVQVDASNWGPINTAISNRSANAFIMFNDGCCVPANISNMVASVAATGAFTPTAGSVYNGMVAAVLNSNSPYSSSFTGLNPFIGGYIQYFNNVPANNALYLSPGSVPPAAGTTPVNNVYGLFIPTAQSYNGQGACLFATVDLSPFVSSPAPSPYDPSAYARNQHKIGPAFLNAVKAGGACGLPAAISKTFAPATVDAGGASTLTITVDNISLLPVTGLNVTDNLPTPVVVGAAASTTCTGGTLMAAVGSSTVSLTGATLPVGGCTITVPVQWPAASAALCTDAGTTVTNTITPGSDFTTGQGQVNTPATATLSCLGAPELHIGKSAPSPGLTVGQISTYTITVSNQGAAAAPGATVQEALPPGLTLASATGSNWSCSGTAPVVCSYSAVLEPGASAAPLLVKVLTQPGALNQVLVNYASVDPLGGNTPPTAGPACAPSHACAQSSSNPVNAPVPVPTLSELALATLALLMAWLAWGQRHTGTRRRH